MSEPYPWHRAPWQRLAEARRNGRLPHALLCFARTGSGQEHFANALIGELLCAGSGAERSRRLLEAGNHPDLLEVRPVEPGRTIRIEQIRTAIAFLQLASHSGGPRIVRLEPIESLPRASSDALLKTLEEPPGHHCFVVLLGHSPAALTATLLSRCMQVSLDGAGHEDLMADWLAEQGIADKEAALAMMRQWSVGPLSVKEMLEQGARELRDTVIEDLCAHRPAPALSQQWQARDSRRVLDWLCVLTRGLVYSRLDMRSLDDKAMAPLLATAQRMDLFLLLGFYDRICTIRRLLEAKAGANPRSLLEEAILEWRRCLRTSQQQMEVDNGRRYG